MSAQPSHLISFLRTSAECSAATGSITILTPWSGATVPRDFSADGTYSAPVKSITSCTVDTHPGAVSIPTPGNWVADFVGAPVGNSLPLVVVGNGSSAMVCINVAEAPPGPSEPWRADKLLALTVCEGGTECTRLKSLHAKGKGVDFSFMQVEIPHQPDAKALAFSLSFRRSQKPAFLIGGPLRRPRKVVRCTLGKEQAEWIKNERDPWLGSYIWLASFSRPPAGIGILETEDDLGVGAQILVQIKNADN